MFHHAPIGASSNPGLGTLPSPIHPAPQADRCCRRTITRNQRVVVTIRVPSNGRVRFRRRRPGAQGGREANRDRRLSIGPNTRRHPRSGRTSSCRHPQALTRTGRIGRLSTMTSSGRSMMTSMKRLQDRDRGIGSRRSRVGEQPADVVTIFVRCYVLRKVRWECALGRVFG